MSTASKSLAFDPEAVSAIRSSINTFDLNAPLTAEEETMMGQMFPPPARNKTSTKAIQDIEEDGFDDNVVPVSSESDFKDQYANYQKCQSIVTFVDFGEVWGFFKEFVLNPFVREQIRADREYRGINPNKSFALKLRRQTAEDFMKSINKAIEEIKAVPKPVLKQQS